MDCGAHIPGSKKDVGSVSLLVLYCIMKMVFILVKFSAIFSCMHTLITVCQITKSTCHVYFCLMLTLFFFIVQGIGNSAQGAANAVLFLLCTKTYRRWIIENFTACCRRPDNTELS